MSGRLTLLGGAFLGDPHRGGADAAPLPADRRGLLLALLATDGGWVDRERLATLFWPESDEGAAKAALRQLLVQVKRLDLGPPLEATATAVRWPRGCGRCTWRGGATPRCTPTSASPPGWVPSSRWSRSRPPARSSMRCARVRRWTCPASRARRSRVGRRVALWRMDESGHEPRPGSGFAARVLWFALGW